MIANNMHLLGIDPGPKSHALVCLNTHTRRVAWYDELPATGSLLSVLAGRNRQADVIACEMLQCQGMPVGAETFETAYGIGRLMEQAGGLFAWVRVYRSEVKLHLCGTCRAKDANIRQALIDRFGGSSAIGTKKAPGPLYGIKSHWWSALAVAVTAEGKA